jgi:antitoxin MazE
MEVPIHRWGNTVGVQIPQDVADSFGIDEHSIVELTKAGDTLVIRKKRSVAASDELLDSIPEDFEYPDDVADFVESPAVGQEQL